MKSRCPFLRPGLCLFGPRVVLAIFVVGMAGVAGVSVAEAAELELRSEVSALVRSWEYETFLERVSVDQTVIPVRLEANLAPWQGAISLDYARSESTSDAGTRELSGLSRFGAQVSRFAMSDRVRLELGAHWILEQGPYDSAEARVVSQVAEPALGMPAGYLGTGHRYYAAAQSVVLDQRGLVGVAGIHVESSGAYDLRDDGLDASGGLAAGLGFAIDQATSLARLHHQIWWRSGRSEDIAGAPAFDLGSEIGLGTEARLPLAAGDLSGGLELIFVSSGSLEPDLLLESGFVRGGNRFRWQLGWEVPGIWKWSLGLEGTHHRGFSSALGRADWVTPSIGLSWGGPVRDIGIGLEYSAGQVREGRDISGFGLFATWSQGWTR